MHAAHSTVAAKYACRHVISRCGRTLRHLEDLCGMFLFLHDLCSVEAEVQVCGPPRSCALAQFAVEAIATRCFYILDSLGRLGF